MNNHLMWFRRDLRLSDNAAFYHALKTATAQGGRVYCIFVFDTAILAHLPTQDRRVTFIWDSLLALDAALREHGASLHVLHGDAVQCVAQLSKQLGAVQVHANHDDEPSALARDAAAASRLSDQGIVLRTYKDHVLFERDEVLSQQGKPYTVFTPYKNAWLRALTPFYVKAYPVERYLAALAAVQTSPSWTSLDAMGFDAQHRMLSPPGELGARSLLDDFLGRMKQYHATRDFPAVKGPSYLSVHLRFGTVSIRTLVRAALAQQDTEGGKVWLNELIWRDFYHQIMFHSPHAMHSAFKPDYAAIEWEQGTQAEERFAAWCEGRTGYPLVDAAQRQLNQTGYMHNRLRMVSACFLIKDLGIDWRRGEAYFARHLNDFDLAANNGGWQWAASTGCDAQPYFRIFNPLTQSEKFDAQGKFIRRYVPELAGLSDKNLHAPWLTEHLLLKASGVELGRTYPHPIVDHAQARAQTLLRYSVVKNAAVNTTAKPLVA
jgi:deoxyribodipyrimidine photo-lyase